MNKQKTNYFLVVLVGVSLFLWGRLLMLQVVEGEYYQVLADENRVKLKVNQALRGVMYDRHGEQLVRNTPEGREYVDSRALGHVLGYVGEISEEELKMCQEKGDCQLGLGEVVGKMGLEKYYDFKLRGVDGGELYEVDAGGQKLREIGKREPVKGENLDLNLDLGLQKKATEVLDDRKGAVIATVPQTGEVLALVSGPSFQAEELEKYLEDEDLPLFNRAISGEYPPGSVYKVVTALGALEEGKVDEETEIEDTGEIKVGIYRFGNWYFDQYGQKEGWLKIVRALARSNDIFFYKLGEYLGMGKLADWSYYLGLGQVTGIDLLGEANGLIPTPEWKEEYIGESWYLGDTYISAIGQGNILTTPLQINQMMGVVASKGKWCRPLLLKSKQECESLDITKKSLETVTEGLKQVAQTGGTAWPFFEFEVKGKRIEVAGKTGTAEFGGEESKETHAWFSVFAPVNEPEIVVTVLLEGAGEGSDEAAPVAKEILEYWFLRQ